MSVKSQLFLLWEMTFTDCPSFSSVDICVYHVGQYHVLTEIEKYGCFSLGITRTFEPAAAMYILIMEYYPDTKSRVNLNINS